MDRIVVRGGRPLRGAVAISGSKNAALPLLFASLLTRERCWFRNVPELADIHTALRLLQGLGADARRPGAHAIELATGRVTSHEAPYEPRNTQRATFLCLRP